MTAETTSSNRAPGRTPPPLLAQLAQWHPALFGERPQPLKRGIYEDLLAAHPGELDATALEQALAFHTRSTRYLNAVAQGLPRMNLQGEVVEAPAPKHIYLALIEVFRRRQQHSSEDLAPKLRRRIAQAFEASGLSQEDYMQLMWQRKNEEPNALLQEALDEFSAKVAREKAMLHAFETSGQSVTAFADMYGLSVREAQRTLAEARQRHANQTAQTETTTP